MCHWVETIVCTKPIHRPHSNYSWLKIYDGPENNGPSVQFWICQTDLKERFVNEAKKAFGKALDQVVRLGSSPEVMFPGGLN